jgi:LDH2 family malate/lactate/ureidoglycolate dehydrogenase
VLRADAGGAFAPLALEQGTPRLAERAGREGLAALSVVNAYNVAALWPEVERLAADGLAAMAFTASISYVAPAGGTRALFGTNPMAFAWPREGKPPVVFDQASSASARGEIQVRMRDGKPIPEGWAVDPEGKPTTDPEAALAGAQLPFGGHKGSSIALMIELLAGALLGDLFSFEASEADTANTGAPRGGELIIAMDPGRFGAEGGRAGAVHRAEELFTRILGQEGTRLPGDRRYAARERTAREGVSLPKAFYDKLLSLAE